MLSHIDGTGECGAISFSSCPSRPTLVGYDIEAFLTPETLEHAFALCMVTAICCTGSSP